MKCRMCGKDLGLLDKGVALIKGRLHDTPQSLMLLGEERLAMKIFDKYNVSVSKLSDIRSDMVVCKDCWKTKFDPVFREEVDRVLEAIAAGPEELHVDRSVGNLMAEYYVGKLAELLQSPNRNVVGWTLYLTFHDLWIYSKLMRELANKILIPNIRELIHHEDASIQEAAKRVVMKYEGKDVKWRSTIWGGTWYETLK